ncbi:MAG: DUF4389 domain-containing protein [Rhizobiaceae bacterium]
MDPNLKHKLTRPSIWMRLRTMIVLAIAFYIAEFVIFAVVIFQFFVTLFTRKPNEHFTRFGRNMARYLQQVTAYLTFASEEKPFPFSPWPDKPHEEEYSEPVVVEATVETASSANQSESVAETVEEIKPKPRTRKKTTTTARKPRTPPKKDV